MAEALQLQQQQQQQQQQVSPQDAKTFLSNFGHDATKLDDAGATKLYGDIYPKYTKAIEDAVNKAKPNGETWRQDYVTASKAQIKDLDEKKMLGRLERYASPNAVVDALLQVQDRISRGEMRSVLPKDAKPEELSKWRAENGIPEKPDGYQVQLADGTVLGEQDKPVIESIKQWAHGQNLHPTQFNGAVELYYDIIDKQATEREENDIKARDAALDHLNKVWGADFRTNHRLIEAFVNTGPPGTKDLLFNARLADGTPIGSHPGILQFLVDRARDVMDVTTLAPSDGAGVMKSIEEEMASIQKMMADKNSEYFKGEKVTVNGVTDTKLAHRWRQLEEAKQRQAARAKR